MGVDISGGTICIQHAGAIQHAGGMSVRFGRDSIGGWIYAVGWTTCQRHVRTIGGGCNRVLGNG